MQGGRRSEGSLHDGSAADGASVYVVTESGVLTPGEYVQKSGGFFGGSGETQATGRSRQLVETGRGARWVEPRVSLDDLLWMYDVNVWHRQAVGVKALLVGGLGWHLKRGDEVIYDPRRDEAVPGDPAAELLARPNPDRLQTFDDLVHRFLIDFGAVGNAYLEVARDRRGKPRELYHVPARTMRRDARLGGYWQTKQGQHRHFGAYGDVRAERNEMLHLYAYDPRDDYYGMPGWYAALAAMGLDRTILEFNTRLFQNGLMAHFAVVVTGGRLSAQGKAAIKRFIQDQAIGIRNAGRVLLIEDEDDRMKVEFKQLNLELKQLIIREVQDHFRDVVVASHGLPPRLLGITQPGQLGATGEVEGQLRTFRETVLRPGKRRLETVLNVLLDEVSEGVRIEFAEMDITSVKDDADFYDRLIERGVFTAEEVRAKIEAGMAT